MGNFRRLAGSRSIQRVQVDAFGNDDGEIALIEEFEHFVHFLFELFERAVFTMVGHVLASFFG
jgi:hypothetical protein